MNFVLRLCLITLSVQRSFCAELSVPFVETNSNIFPGHNVVFTNGLTDETTTVTFSVNYSTIASEQLTRVNFLEYTNSDDLRYTFIISTNTGTPFSPWNFNNAVNTFNQIDALSGSFSVTVGSLAFSFSSEIKVIATLTSSANEIIATTSTYIGKFSKNLLIL